MLQASDGQSSRSCLGYFSRVPKLMPHVAQSVATSLVIKPGYVLKTRRDLRLIADFDRELPNVPGKNMHAVQYGPGPGVALTSPPILRLHLRHRVGG